MHILICFRLRKCFSKDTLWASLLHILWALWSSSLLDLDQCSGEVLWRTCQEAGPVSDEKRSKPGKAFTCLPLCCVVLMHELSLNILTYLLILVVNEHLHKYKFSQMVLHRNNWMGDLVWYISSAKSFSKMRSVETFDTKYRSCSFYGDIYLLVLETCRTNVGEAPFHRHSVQAPLAWK